MGFDRSTIVGYDADRQSFVPHPHRNSMNALKVMGISGSHSLDSSNGRLLLLGLAACERAGAETCHWSMDDKPLPLVGAPGSWESEVVKEFQGMVKEADAFLLTSPEYHGSFSGVMKNQLDWIYGDFVKGKVSAVMSTLGGVSNSNTLNHLRLVMRQLHVHCISAQICVPKVKDAFDDEGHLVDEDLSERLETVASNLVTMAVRLSS